MNESVCFHIPLAGCGKNAGTPGDKKEGEHHHEEICDSQAGSSCGGVLSAGIRTACTAHYDHSGSRQHHYQFDF